MTQESDPSKAEPPKETLASLLAYLKAQATKEVERDGPVTFYVKVCTAIGITVGGIAFILSLVGSQWHVLRALLPPVIYLVTGIVFREIARRRNSLGYLAITKGATWLAMLSIAFLVDQFVTLRISPADKVNTLDWISLLLWGVDVVFFVQLVFRSMSVRDAEHVARRIEIWQSLGRLMPALRDMIVAINAKHTHDEAILTGHLFDSIKVVSQHITTPDKPSPDLQAVLARLEERFRNTPNELASLPKLDMSKYMDKPASPGPGSSIER